jgi:serine/threonine protein kinase
LIGQLLDGVDVHFKPEEIVRYLIAIANGMGYLHQNSLLYRDLKVASCLMTMVGWHSLFTLGSLVAVIACSLVISLSTWIWMARHYTFVLVISARLATSPKRTSRPKLLVVLDSW